ncbi:cation transporter [Microbulbifer sp. SH-1]|uniref:cation transporter n=1 Tax=Microbulbifer sp. SH-1 TaxID=2681547 RepID=UPI00140B3988|nr:cation transporter [Microbulbifer sp. SH-1]QIL88704.1 cation transporter [Microbulbifer sp. SH-1]
MRLAPEHEFSTTQEKYLGRAVCLEWLTLAYLLSVAVLMYLVMGTSQAMRTAWIEDLLSMIPPVVFLIANRVRKRKPDNHFPYGLHSATSLGYLVAALALLIVGGYLAVDALLKLLQQHHPTIGLQSYFGVDIWLGWWMLPVLVWAVIPPVILGHAKAKLAKPLYDKILYTDAEMNKADWQTGVAAMVGVIGIGVGLWWTDAAAALFISVSILKDGLRQTSDALNGLLSRAPKELGGKFSDTPEKIQRELAKMEWAESVQVRLREEGHLFFGEGFYCSRSGCAPTDDDLRRACEIAVALDWRLLDFVLTPLPREAKSGQAE